MRIDGRTNKQIRTIKIQRNVNLYAEGSSYITCGNTKVLCTATVLPESPFFRNGKGWVTAEYNMLPRATHTRNRRDISSLKKNSRSSEIERLIGRSLRACVDLHSFEDATIILDCDVIQADGGTRTACINAAFVAMHDAFEWMIKNEMLSHNPINKHIAAISAGIVDSEIMVDLCYSEDSNAYADVNVIMDDLGNIAEIQATGEKGTIMPEQLNKIMDICAVSIKEIIEIQKECLSINE